VGKHRETLRHREREKWKGLKWKWLKKERVKVVLVALVGDDDVGDELMMARRHTQERG